MSLHCAPICQTCDAIYFNNVCGPLPDAVPAWRRGDQYRMFERMLNDPEMKTKYGTPAVHSQPTEENNYEKPWIVTIDEFATKEECEKLMEFGNKVGYERSMTVGDGDQAGVISQRTNSARTSKNTWCEDAECYKDATVKPLFDRIAHATNIPETNSDFLQLVKYEEGQFYKDHHDYLSHHVYRQCGPRIVTLFVYLNDVEEGGETTFPELGLSIQPKQGKALIWSNVLNDAPYAQDPTTRHEAMPVVKGVKYGANAWIHLFDFKEPYERGCIPD